MSKLSYHANKYSRIRMERTDDEILRITLHTNGGSMVFWPEAHEQLAPAFLDVGSDPDTKVIVLTGVGDTFIEEDRYRVPSESGGHYGVVSEF